jgi:hypothetical protein
LSRFATSFVLGYHGCDKGTARAVLACETDLKFSRNEYDWLGSGIYFWEGDPVRALEWAKDNAHKFPTKEPGVVGAVIDLRNCLDFSSRNDMDAVAAAYQSLKDLYDIAGLEMPENGSPKGTIAKDRVFRYLDRAVIDHLHEIYAASKTPLEPFDTVRGVFVEGDGIFPGAALLNKSQVQIAVRSRKCILGYFTPRINGKPMI